MPAGVFFKCPLEVPGDEIVLFREALAPAGLWRRWDVEGGVERSGEKREQVWGGVDQEESKARERGSGGEQGKRAGARRRVRRESAIGR